MRISLLAIFFALASLLSPLSYSKSIPGVEGPYVNIVDDQILVTLGLSQLELEGGLELPIPRTIKSTASLGPNAVDGGSLFTLKIDKADIMKALNVNVGDAQTLPDGRAIPGIPGGELQNAIRIDLPKEKYNLSFYFHKKIFGVYIPFNFNFPIAQSFSVKLKYKGKDIGTLYLVNKDGDKKAAGVIFLRINEIKENDAFLHDLNE